ncbi:transcription factor HES-5-like [Clupea harengus]|uniref:Transcription factor HES-5-like n=1 Tax=Clupea harengus TaxID=7950 RepID=A0A6P3WEN2_CLUHA|nr:transcription factor HES-5-like [Clupea harengus]
MAPTITSTADYSKEHLSLTHKQRKPAVEKMRRDRINNCIEELKALLGPQLLNQQPESKMEKADILEMTVCLLRRKLQPRSLPSLDADHQGFSMCARQVVHFLSRKDVQTQSHRTVLNHFQTLKPSSDEDVQESALPQLSMLDQDKMRKERSPARSAPWRPW